MNKISTADIIVGIILGAGLLGLRKSFDSQKAKNALDVAVAGSFILATQPVTIQRSVK